MEEIKNILAQKDITIEKLIECFDLVKANGDVAAIKFDGERTRNQYTVFISFPNKGREIIRSDGEDLRAALINVLNEYIG
ncbi:hypothetical protein F0L74_21940 [Chitinophaga agrisoli]|uniref:Uncharacterized protein n=1 Tax=Chitinophaga agrisoli TaxID=2607653 RepID=A0A5B2VJP0_9BACT|nr:hypothetical protein [Chitinophaga agrisoli]KAA2238878.1 hypothetical protein F0L74_21940 [Chitinophaga agrisoli]